MQFPLVIPGMNVYVIGRDGINYPAPALLNQTGTRLVTPDNMFDGTTIDLPMGSRVEMLVQAPQTPGTYTLRAVALGGSDIYPSFDFAQFVVSGAPVTMGIPASLPVPTREYPPIVDSEITAHHTVTFSMGSTSSILTGLGFYINNVAYDESHIDAYPSLGTAEEWTLINTATIEGFSDPHPFHIHVNSFEVTAINGVPVATPEFRDTFTVPPAPAGGTTSVRIRIRFKQFRGKTLYHCHFLGHEDTGMMQNIMIG